MLPPNWHHDLQVASVRTTPEQEKEFGRLVDLATGQVTSSVAKALMATFSDRPDFGTQERVCSTLATAPEAIQVSAILAEMPRLIAEAPQWADALLSELLEHHIALVQQRLPILPAETRLAVRQIAMRPDFLEFQPEAKRIHAYCK